MSGYGGLTSQAVAIGVGLLLSRGLGFARDIVIAARFGASRETDAYLVSAQVPVVFDALLAGNALYSALLPSATTAVMGPNPKERLAHLVKSATTFVLLLCGSVSIVGVLFASQLVSVFGGGLPPDVHALARRLTSVTVLSLPFIALTSVTWAALNTLGKFWGPAVTLSFGNLALIAFAVLLGPGIGIYALALGLAVGSILQVGSQFLQLRRNGIPFGLGIDFRDPAFQRSLTILWPLGVSGIITALSPAVDNFVATYLPSGGVTVIRYAQGLTVPFSLLSVAISMAVLPRLSKAAALNDTQVTCDLLRKSVRMLCLVLFGVAGMLIILRGPVVAIAYHHGAFDHAAVERTSQTLAMYALAIPFASTYYLLLRALLAYTKVRALIMINAGMLILNLVLDFAFLPYLAHAGIALSSACVQIVYVVLAVLVLQHEIKGKRIASTVLAPLASNGIAAMLGIGLSYLARVGVLCIAPRSGEAVLLITQVVIFVPSYMTLSKIMGFCELTWVRTFFKGLVADISRALRPTVRNM